MVTNFFHLDCGSNSTSCHGYLIYNTINSLGLCILNNGSPIHVSHPNLSSSAIDISFCSSDLFWNQSWHTLNDPYSSDHYPILITNSSFSSSHPSSPISSLALPKSIIHVLISIKLSEWHFLVKLKIEYRLHLQILPTLLEKLKYLI